jgi:hypothetical protein
MLTRAIRLKDSIDLYCLKYQENEEDYRMEYCPLITIMITILTTIIVLKQDWQDLQKLHDFLQYFQDATLASESRFSTVESILPIMDYLLEKLEGAKMQYKDDAYIGPCCNASWAKLDKYYGLTERSPVYTVALILCP